MRVFLTRQGLSRHRKRSGDGARTYMGGRVRKGRHKWKRFQDKEIWVPRWRFLMHVRRPYIYFVTAGLCTKFQKEFINKYLKLLFWLLYDQTGCWNTASGKLFPRRAITMSHKNKLTKSTVIEKWKWAWLDIHFIIVISLHTHEQSFTTCGLYCYWGFRGYNPYVIIIIYWAMTHSMPTTNVSHLHNSIILRMYFFIFLYLGQSSGTNINPKVY